MDEDYADPTITRSPVTEACAFIGGFVAAEGCFTWGAGRPRFAVVVGAADLGMLRFIREVLGVGSVRLYARRKPHYDDEAVFAVTHPAKLIQVVVPFMDRWLPPSYKREQYLAWRKELLEQHGRS